MRKSFRSFIRQNPGFAEFLANQHVGKLGELDSAKLRELLALYSRHLGERQINSLAPSLRLLFHGGIVRTKSEEARQNAHHAHKIIAVCAHDAHSASVIMPSNSTTKGYAGKKKRTNLSLDAELVKVAAAYFKTTTYGSISGFLEAKMRSEYRTNAPRLRKAKIAIPASVFAK